MARRSILSVVLALSLLANVFCLPAEVLRIRRQTNEEASEKSSSETPPVPIDDDDDFDDEPTPVASGGSGGGGSNIMSLLHLVGAFLPTASDSSSGGSPFITIISKFIQDLVKQNKKSVTKRAIHNNNIDFEYIADLKPPPFQKQEHSNSINDSDESEDDKAVEESIEEFDDEKESNQNSDSNASDDEDSDEPPGGGDGQGGGLLGLFAGLSGDEDGQSDLGSLLATVSGIIANLSGDGIDINALIASGLGLFVGLLSEGNENPGSVIASYLLTSLDTISGGGAKNNGAFFGNFLSKLIKGTSAAGDPDDDSEQSYKMMSDSTGFVLSLLTSLSGDMSKGSSGSYLWR